jgi:hypothetical protein
MLEQKIQKLLKVLRKLDHPPAGPNWVRFIFDDPIRTAKAILAFAKGQPQFNYQPGYRAIRDRVELGIDLEAALRVASDKGAPAGREPNKDLVEAFFEHDESRQYSASNPIGFDTEYFRVSREVLIPVAPLTIIRENGLFVPIFVCGWTENPLTQTQRRLLSTIYEDAFLSLTDYQKSPAEVLFFPKGLVENVRKRQPEVWYRGDYETLPKSDLDRCVEIFVRAREMARAVLLDEIETLRKLAEEEKSAAPSEPQPPTPDGPLFTKK